MKVLKGIGFMILFCTVVVVLSKGMEGLYKSSAAAKARQAKIEQVFTNIGFSFAWGKAGFDNILEADFNINNKNILDVKDIVIRCGLYAKSGTFLGAKEHTIYDVVNGKEIKSFNGVNMGFINSQTANVNCEIVDLTVV